MKSFYLIIGFLLFLSLYSCGHIDAEATLQQAEDSLQTGNLELAISNCDLLSDSTAHQLTSTQMCRVAIIYARLSELSDNQDYMASATQCYERAVDLDADDEALDNYIANLDEEDQCVMRVIRELSHALSSPYDYLEEHDLDTDAITDEIIEMSDPNASTASI